MRTFSGIRGLLGNEREEALAFSRLTTGRKVFSVLTTVSL
jgi:hypothetical protein